MNSAHNGLYQGAQTQIEKRETLGLPTISRQFPIPYNFPTILSSLNNSLQQLQCISFLIWSCARPGICHKLPPAKVLSPKKFEKSLRTRKRVAALGWHRSGIGTTRPYRIWKEAAAAVAAVEPTQT